MGGFDEGEFAGEFLQAQDCRSSGLPFELAQLIISHTPYKYQFPADFGTQAIRCSPATGYETSVKYSFYRVPNGKLTILQDFGEQAACSTNHNPAIFMKKVTPAMVPRRVGYEFAVYDYAVTPPGGWELMSVADFEQHKAAFLTAYNAEGMRVVAPFRSGNCCFAVKGGLKLTISSARCRDSLRMAVWRAARWRRGSLATATLARLTAK